jgi:L-threonylcarbamoyladenylate synthase
MIWSDSNLINKLKDGEVVVMPTDTIYGLVGKAEYGYTVNRIYDLKKRAPEKPSIILLNDIKELEKFSVFLSEKQKEEIKKYWSFDENQDSKVVPTSIVLDCFDEELSYLHRGTKTLAFRIPALAELRNLLKETGPLIAPSANHEGKPPAKNIMEAKRYFGNAVDLYLDGGEITGKASKVIKLHKDGTVDILRE